MTPVIETEQRISDLLSAYGIARSTIAGSPLSPSELQRTHAYWRACNYLALGMIYLQDNPRFRCEVLEEAIPTGAKFSVVESG
jgi:xylulose-5-phosphate/fructose-6-phosphate phosphoketolase